MFERRYHYVRFTDELFFQYFLVILEANASELLRNLEEYLVKLIN